MEPWGKRQGVRCVNGVGCEEKEATLVCVKTYKGAAFERGGCVERHTGVRWLEWRRSAMGRVESWDSIPRAKVLIGGVDPCEREGRVSRCGTWSWVELGKEEGRCVGSVERTASVVRCSSEAGGAGSRAKRVSGGYVGLGRWGKRRGDVGSVERTTSVVRCSSEAGGAGSRAGLVGLASGCGSGLPARRGTASVARCPCEAGGSGVEPGGGRMVALRHSILAGSRSRSRSVASALSLSGCSRSRALGQGGSGWQVGVGRVCGQAVWGTTRRCGYVQADELADEGAAYKRAAFERARGLRAYLRAVAGVEMDGDGPCRRVAKE